MRFGTSLENSGRLKGNTAAKSRVVFGWLLLGASCALAGAPAPVTLANPMQGTDSEFRYSHGNEYPAIALPFPMNTWAPYTQPARGFVLLPIPPAQDPRHPPDAPAQPVDRTIMPCSPSCRSPASWPSRKRNALPTFRHEDEEAQPSYYRVRLDTWKATAEVTPTERCARFRFTFEEPGDAYVVLDAFPGGSSVEDHSRREQDHRHQPFQPRRCAGQFRQLLCGRFRPPVLSPWRLVARGSEAGGDAPKAKHAGAFVKFDARTNGMVSCKVASSFISPEQALRNLQGKSATPISTPFASRAEARWNEALGRARVEGGTEDQRRTFYSALYRSILYPHRFYELDENGPPGLFQPLRRQGARGRALHRHGFLGHLPRRASAL